MIRDLNSAGAPCSSGVAVAKHDTDDQSNGPYRCLILQDDATVALRFLDGTELAMPLKAGIPYWFMLKGIKNTGTTGGVNMWLFK